MVSSALCVSRASLASRATVRPRASMSQKVQQVAQAAAISVASLALTFAAHADTTVKLGSDTGGLVFEPATVTIKSGETVTWINNAGFPHNVVFDEDAVPEGVNADAISKEDYLNAPKESYSHKFDKAGSYGYYCEPHQGAGMKGTIIVQ